MNFIKALLNLGKIKAYISDVLTVAVKLNAVLTSVEDQLKDYSDVSVVKEVVNGINAVQLYLEKVLGLLGASKDVYTLSSGDPVKDLKSAIAKLKG